MKIPIQHLFKKMLSLGGLTEACKSLSAKSYLKVFP